MGGEYEERNHSWFELEIYPNRSNRPVGNHIARVLADSSGAPLGCTPTMPLPGQTKAESDQERIMLALERIANILKVMNANLATVAKTMIDARPIGRSSKRCGEPD